MPEQEQRVMLQIDLQPSATGLCNSVSLLHHSIKRAFISTVILIFFSVLGVKAELLSMAGQCP